MLKSRISILLELRAQSWDKEGGWTIPLALALEGLEAADASWQPPQGGWSIRQLVNHINFYNERQWYRLADKPFTKTAPDNNATFDSNEGRDGEESWQETLAHTKAVAEGLREELAKLSDSDLNVPYGHSTLGEYLTNWVMHDTFHIGQIVLLRKLQGSWTVKLS